jgi:hypothetical protein
MLAESFGWGQAVCVGQIRRYPAVFPFSERLSQRLSQNSRQSDLRMDLNLDFFTVASLIVVVYIARVVWDIGRNNAKRNGQGHS